MTAESKDFSQEDEAAREMGRQVVERLFETTNLTSLDRVLEARSIVMAKLMASHGYIEWDTLRQLPWRGIYGNDVSYVAGLETGAYFLVCLDGGFYLRPPGAIVDDFQTDFYSRDSLPIIRSVDRSVVVPVTKNGKKQGPNVVRLYVQKPPEGGRTETFRTTKNLVRTARNAFDGVSQRSGGFVVPPGPFRR